MTSRTLRRAIENPVPFKEREALTVAKTAGMLSLSRGTIHKLVKNKELQSICVGRRRLILRESVDKLLNPQPRSTRDVF